MRIRATRWAAGAALLTASSLLAACGGSGSSDTASSSAAGGGAAAATERGPITYVQGKDVSGTVQAQLDEWNTAHPNEKVTLVELPDAADAQRQQMIQNAQTKSDAYTVLSVDVVWVSEFAANRWIDELPADKFNLDKMLPAITETAKYRDKVYSVPASSDGGLLYYRTDLLKAAGIAAPPKTFEEMQATCTTVQATPEGKGIGCFAGQYEKYEGLTVNFAEAINSAGGVITDSSGKPNVNTAEAKAGVNALVDGFKSGFIAKEAITYREEPGRQAFQAGKLLFHRQWPYQFSLANKTDGSSKVAGKFAVTALPGIGSAAGASSLGGHNVAVSSFAKNKATAIDFISWFTSEANQRINLTKNSNAPTFTALYDDPALAEQFPYLPALKASIEHAVPRPKVVKYGDVTAAIQDAAYAALTGAKTTDAALAELQDKLTTLTQ